MITGQCNRVRNLPQGGGTSSAGRARPGGERLRAIGRIAPERLTRFKRVATIESIGSSIRIEGAKLTDREVDRLLSKIKSFASRDEQEVAGYAVMEAVFSAWEAIDFTENHIKQLHRDLLVYSVNDKRHRGEYKSLPNHLEALGPDGVSLSTVVRTASPFYTPQNSERSPPATVPCRSEAKPR